jgi:hypothetical protein
MTESEYEAEVTSSGKETFGAYSVDESASPSPAVTTVAERAHFSSCQKYPGFTKLRYLQCTKWYAKVVDKWTDPRTGKKTVLGRMHFKVEWRVQSHRKDTQLTGIVEMRTDRAWGTAESVRFEIDAKCGGPIDTADCVSGHTHASFFISLSTNPEWPIKRGDGSYYLTRKAPSASSTSKSPVYLQIDPQGIGKRSPVYRTLDIRCDYRSYLSYNVGAGCVVPSFRPVVYFSLSGVTPLSADHILDAQIAGKPGAINETPLSRHYWGSSPNLNRKEARYKCRTRWGKGTLSSRNPPEDCDEYPFASSQQGCDDSNGHCSVRGVERGDNRRSGSKLGKFYKTMRILHGDKYYVRILS